MLKCLKMVSNDKYAIKAVADSDFRDFLIYCEGSFDFQTTKFLQ